MRINDRDRWKGCNRCMDGENIENKIVLYCSCEATKKREKPMNIGQTKQRKRINK